MCALQIFIIIIIIIFIIIIILFPLLLDLKLFRHLPLDLYTFFNRRHLPTITANRGPIVPVCYKSSVYPLDTHTHTPIYTVHMALMGYFIVFSFVTKPGQTLEFLLWGTIVPLNFLAGYYCSIVASTPQPTVYAFTHTFVFACNQVLSWQTGMYCSPLW